MTDTWKMPESYQELAAIATAFDAGPDPIVNGHIWTERHKFSDADWDRLFVEKRFGDTWVITQGGRSVLNRFGKWEYEPLPSNREDDFLDRTRYKSAREAIELADYFRTRVTKWFQLEIAKDPLAMTTKPPKQEWIGSDDNKIFHAAVLAYAAHRGQCRKYVDDVPYIIHPASIANQTEAWVILNSSESELAFKLIRPQTRMLMTSAAWGHDVGEDCDPRWMELYKEFDLGVFDLIVELTNPSKKRPDLNRADRKKMDREHLGHVSWMAKVIKLIDRGSNLMEIADQPAEADFKRLYARESEALLPFLSSPETKDLEEEYMVWVRHLIDTKG
jgi:hypothetical protein